MSTIVEYIDKNKNYPQFFECIKNKKISVVSDFNTNKFALDFIKKCSLYAKEIIEICFDDKDLIPDENVCNTVKEKSKDVDYILAVGSGSLNDVCKYVSTKLNSFCAVLPTACSMDGYVSKGSALMENGFKVTENVNPPKYVLINADVLLTAPQIMTAAGFGDIIGKYTCLTDWKLSNILNGEPINEKAFSLMEQARKECVDSFDELLKKDKNAILKLMNALLTAGFSMAICGNSRPASGSEHHISHYLEMDFIRNGKRVPPHGVKVAIGTLISIEIYNFIKDNEIKFDKCEKVYELCNGLPKVETLKEMLKKIGCPTRFSEIGVSKELFDETIKNAYLVRDRFTVLTLVNKLNIVDKLIPILEEKYL